MTLTRTAGMPIGPLARSRQTEERAESCAGAKLVA